MEAVKKVAGKQKARKLSASERRDLETTKRIRLAVIKAGGTQALAEKLGINASTVWRWTIGSTRPRSKPVLEALAKFLLS